MKFFEQKASELNVGTLVLVVILSGVAAFIVGSFFMNAVTTQNVVVTPGGNSFVKPTYFGPLAKASADKYAADQDKAIAQAATKKS